jgi:calpain-15
MSVLAEKPGRIENLFITKDINKHGAYAVGITKNGQKLNVVVDDFLPCLENKPAFSKGVENDLWLLILEKAWAKIHGSYDRIRRSGTFEPMRDLTAAPSYEYNLKEDQG